MKRYIVLLALGVNVAMAMANPAWVFCEEKGGKAEIRKDAEGNEYGICIFKDKVCKQWPLFHGTCEKPDDEPEKAGTPDSQPHR